MATIQPRYGHYTVYGHHTATIRSQYGFCSSRLATDGLTGNAVQIEATLGVSKKLAGSVSELSMYN